MSYHVRFGGRGWLALVAGLLWMTTGTRAVAQAHETATRAAEIAVFGEFALIHPDYGEATDKGIVAGADFTRFFRTPVQPSLEVRLSYAPDGLIVGEHVAMIGGRGDLRLRRLPRLHPYANFLVGAGTISFTHPIGSYTSDTSTVYNYGGGATFDLRRRISVQAEVEQQHWNLGSATNPQPLTPLSINFGVQYHIPFGRRR